MLTTGQDRARQKGFLEVHGHPVGPWLPVSTPAELASAVRTLGPCRVKRTRDGYDGRGQVRVADPAEATAAMARLGGPCVAEQELDLAAELSVLVARSSPGAVALHPPALNWHEDGVLRFSLLPAPLPAAVLQQASRLAKELAEQLDLVGVLVVECFLTTDGRLWVNELAPRPHNTFHHAEAVCPTGQFEQFVRALCGLPLGATEARGSALLVNLLGDLWAEGTPAFAEALAVPGVSLHLYGKAPRPGRKVGHLTLRAASREQVFARAEAALDRLELAGPPRPQVRGSRGPWPPSDFTSRPFRAAASPASQPVEKAICRL